jgi:hypothetical protein
VDTLEDDARSYLSRTLHGMDVSSVPFEAVVGCIESSYEGGWAAYKADYERVMQVAAKPKPVLTPFQKWVKLSRMIGGSPQFWHLRPHQEVQSVEVNDHEAKAVIKLARTKETASRDVVQYGYKLIAWKRTDNGWSAPEDIEVWTEVAEEIVRWGRVRTEDWVESQKEQFETCFRPGTHKSPMQGPAARLEVSREEFHNIPKGN